VEDEISHAQIIFKVNSQNVMLDAVNRIKDNRAMLINSSVHSAHQN
jgi:hypothetical protein